MPRLFGVGFKRVPKFGFLLGVSFMTSDEGQVGLVAATAASILSAPFINPVRMVEKQQRAYFKQTGVSKPIQEILMDAAQHNYKPLFRGTIPLMGHSLASATTGLVGQPRLERYIKDQLKDSTIPGSQNQLIRGIVASSLVSPIYVVMTNPLSRLEVIMQTHAINSKPISISQACQEVFMDCHQFGIRGMFRGQGIGVAKAIISLTMFHQGRLFITDTFKLYNIDNTA
jgi:hypothetical protein